MLKAGIMMEYPFFDFYRNKKLHIGICGSVAAYKIIDLMRRFQDCGIIVSITLTPSAQNFINPLSFEALGAATVYTKMFDELSTFAHLEPGQVADAMLIAPASATTLARLANGFADELLACQALSFDGPIILAPAMNSKMWANPATAYNVETLQERGYFLIEPESGELACKEIGAGRLADLRQIYLETLKLLTEQDLYGKKVLITMGPTQEKWDAVRIWTNNSTGNMGQAFALSAWLRGAEVHCICGPVKQFMPQDSSFFRYDVTNADAMFSACDELWDQMDYGIFTAAVADFKPLPFKQANHAEDETSDFELTKFKKENRTSLSVDFVPNKDILKTLAARKTSQQKIMGFAAEADGENLNNLIEAKLLNKNCDLLVGNLVQSAMGSSHNQVLVASTKHKSITLDNMPKTDLAWKLISNLIDL